ncbi:hypothetical protein [Oscillibacter sp.]|uniref:hypothetical protein n=1 Tax=Oscillibacter sp. TaxID=1945593 RepID=UPI0028A95A19|nr:hypothetical protein [Oscillibacter sp.]
MKKPLLLAAALCLALALSACGQNPPAAGSSGSSAAVSSGVASSETPGNSDSQPSRDAHTVLTMEVEGQAEEVPATLYEGEGYSIYIPDEGWVKNSGELPKGAVDQWVSADNSEVTLTICGSEADEQWVENQKRVIEGVQESGAYTVYMAYPDEAAEGFGARLPVIAETFLVAE